MITFFLFFIDRKKPIRVINRPKKKKKRLNLFDEECIPDMQENFKMLFEHKGNVIQKSTKPCRKQGDYNPDFIKNIYNHKKHDNYLNTNITIGNTVPQDIKKKLLDVIKEYWCCFDPDGVKIPISDYEVVIDTGTNKPVSTKSYRYGMHESPIMQKAVDALHHNDQIGTTTQGGWLSRGTLASKPHQENIIDIDKYIWRFCINLIPLNQRTRIIAYPIPRCDDAVKLETGNARLCILLDACSGYHQLKMEAKSALKTAFAAPDGRKYFYKVMPFGIVNGPTIFVIFIFDMRINWNDLAREYNIKIGPNNNTRIIIDDTYMFIETYMNGIGYLRAVLEISKRYSLSWKLKKCSFFPERVEFVGHDRRADGNSPAASKIPLLRTWPDFTIIRDISSFVGFSGFYSDYIPWYEERISELRLIMRKPLADNLTDEDMNEKAKYQINDIKNALLADPLLRRADTNKRIYLRTDFSSFGFGFVILQPANDKVSQDAMIREEAGGVCEFDMKKKGPRLLPCAFGSKKIAGYQKHVHGSLGEGLALRYAINKNRHVCWGKQFTAIIDCWSLK